MDELRPARRERGVTGSPAGDEECLDEKGNLRLCPAALRGAGAFRMKNRPQENYFTEEKFIYSFKAWS